MLKRYFAAPDQRHAQDARVSIPQQALYSSFWTVPFSYLSLNEARAQVSAQQPLRPDWLLQVTVSFGHPLVAFYSQGDPICIYSRYYYCLCHPSTHQNIKIASNMLRVHQKRRFVTFAGPQTQASSSKAAAKTATTPATTAPTVSPSKPKFRHFRNDSNPNRVTQQSHSTPVKFSNRQRRLASLFMALMASSPLPIEADAETLEVAQRASIAPRAGAGTQQKQRFSALRVQEVRSGRWKRFRYELSLKTRRRKTGGRYEVEMDELVEHRSEARSKGSDMV